MTMEALVEPGLRERQKTKRRTRIKSAARKQFLSQGYPATNMETIADEAEVGVATVYNYFGSKGKLLVEILREDFTVLAEAAQQVLACPPANASEGVLTFMEHYQRFQDNWEHKDLLVAVMGPGIAAEPALGELSMEVEGILKQQLNSLLSYYQESGAIRQGIDIHDAALIIFYIFNQHFIEFVSLDGESFEIMKADMDRQISFFVNAIC